MSSQHRSSDDSSTQNNSSPYIVLKTDPPKWTPEENDRFLDMIDNRVMRDIWSAKSEEKVVNRSSGEKKSWTAIFKKISKS